MPNPICAMCVVEKGEPNPMTLAFDGEEGTIWVCKYHNPIEDIER